MSLLQDFKVYSREDEEKLNAFCEEHGITRCCDEFYFDLNGVHYRISRFKIKISDTSGRGGIPKAKFRFQTDTVYFQAKRNMVRLIYNSLVAGYSEEDIKKELERRQAKSKVPPPPKVEPEPLPPGDEEEEVYEEPISKSDLISDLLRRR